jgi:hypothetical protein
MIEADNPGDRLSQAFDAPSHIVGADDSFVTAAAFKESFGEDVRRTLDIGTWRVGSDLSQEYARVEREVREAVERETALQKTIRAELFPRLKHPKAPKNAGVHQADQKTIERIHTNLLFRGGVEACDGAIQVHETLPLTIYQMGVSLVSYQGDRGTWCQRLFRRDLQQSCPNRLAEVIEVLERRSKRSGSQDGLGELARKAILAYAERAILLRESRAPWRMGKGNPITYELLTGGSNLELMVEATTVIRALVEQHQKFVFVAEQSRKLDLLTIGQALHPMEFAIVRTLDEEVEDWLHQRRYSAGVSPGLVWDNDVIPPVQWIPRFIERVASKIVVGLFRATEVAPAQTFYAHLDHADLAAHIVLADSLLQQHRGVPMLADIARHVCIGVFSDSLESIAANAYAAAGVPWRYFNGQSKR